MHTATATSLCIDNQTGIPFDARTFPISCGPGKADHKVVFQALQESLASLGDQSKLMWSHYHSAWTTVQYHIIAMLMDQPERRSSTCLLAGNARQHALFGVSCHFDQLERKFAACPKCVRTARRYFLAGNFATPVVYACRQCYSFSLQQLLDHGKYVSGVHPPLATVTPGYKLAVKPCVLSFEILLDGWNYVIQKLVYDKTWQKKDALSIRPPLITLWSDVVITCCPKPPEPIPICLTRWSSRPWRPIDW